MRPLKIALLSALYICTINIHCAQSVAPKIILCGIKDVLLWPDINAIPGGALGAFVGITPQSAEKELFQVLRKVPWNGMRSKQSTGIYSPIMCYWVLTANSSSRVKKIVQKYISKKYWFVKKARLNMAADYAFTPRKTTQILKPNKQMASLLRWCKKKGLTLILCANWNKESLNAVTNANKALFSIFDASYISSEVGMLTYEKPFFKKILAEQKTTAQNCILIDAQPETILAARRAGIRTIKYTNTQTTARALRNYKVI